MWGIWIACCLLAGYFNYKERYWDIVFVGSYAGLYILMKSIMQKSIRFGIGELPAPKKADEFGASWPYWLMTIMAFCVTLYCIWYLVA